MHFMDIKHHTGRWNLKKIARSKLFKVGFAALWA